MRAHKTPLAARLAEVEARANGRCRALSLIEAWSRGWHGDSRTLIRNALRLIHEAATNALDGVYPAQAAPVPCDIDEADDGRKNAPAEGEDAAVKAAVRYASVQPGWEGDSREAGARVAARYAYRSCRAAADAEIAALREEIEHMRAGHEAIREFDTDYEAIGTVIREARALLGGGS